MSRLGPKVSCAVKGALLALAKRRTGEPGLRAAARGVAAGVVLLGAAGPAWAAPCPSDMVDTGFSCVDRFESSLVDASTAQPLSPYYPPVPAALARVLTIWQVERSCWGDERGREFPLPELSVLQRSGSFVPRTRSQKGVVPQGYLSRDTARLSCERAGKRLCRLEEWQRACRGERDRKFPYGHEYRRGVCNVARQLHPAFVLHGNSSLGHLDPRLNLVSEGEVPLLFLTGALPDCASSWGRDRLYDMVGNLDEWVDDESGIFVGGFYARGTTEGCEAKISSHAPSYFDYSTGVRCCKDHG